MVFVSYSWKHSQMPWKTLTKSNSNAFHHFRHWFLSFFLLRFNSHRFLFTSRWMIQHWSVLCPMCVLILSCEFIHSTNNLSPLFMSFWQIISFVYTLLSEWYSHTENHRKPSKTTEKRLNFSTLFGSVNVCSIYVVSLFCESWSWMCSVLTSQREQNDGVKKNPNINIKSDTNLWWLCSQIFNWNSDKSSCSSSYSFSVVSFSFFFLFCDHVHIPYTTPDATYSCMQLQPNSILSLQRIGSVKRSRMEKTLECLMFAIQSIYFAARLFPFLLSHSLQFIRRQFRFGLDLYTRTLFRQKHDFDDDEIILNVFILK